MNNQYSGKEIVAPLRSSIRANPISSVSDLPARSDLHLARKAYHLITGLMIVACYMSGMEQPTALLILGGLLAWSLVAEYIRLKNPIFNEKCVRFFGSVIRSHEVNKVSGMPYYIASSFFAIAIFPKTVAVLAILYLALGDPIASLIGILFGKRSIQLFGGKSLHGTAAGFLVCALVTWLFLRYNNGLHGLPLIRLTLLGGFAGALAELLPFELDDNFTIPVVSGFVLWFGFIALYFI